MHHPSGTNSFVCNWMILTRLFMCASYFWYQQFCVSLDDSQKVTYILTYVATGQFKFGEYLHHFLLIKLNQCQITRGASLGFVNELASVICPVPLKKENGLEEI